MKAEVELSVAQARALHLAAQGLLERPRRRVTAEDVLGAIRRMGALQIDTISVVARSPYLVLWSRLGAYQTTLLEHLLAAGRVFEYWSHAACFLPIEEFPLYRRRMLYGSPRSHAWLEAHAEVAERVLALVRERGEVRSADFERQEGQSGGWWDWKPEKVALEQLFNVGQLMIARRENFHRIYAPTERVLPGWSDERLPTEQDARRELTVRAVRALGVTRAGWVADYFRQAARPTVTLVRELAGAGQLLTVRVRGWDEPWYVHPDHSVALERAAAGQLRPARTVLLSPFDPVVWDRTRALELFDFHYRIEVYTPNEQRRFGYFSLPILHRGALVGRLDPKAHRRQGVLEVRAVHLEPGVRVSESLAGGLSRALPEFAAWQGLPEVVVRRSDPPELLSALPI